MLEVQGIKKSYPVTGGLFKKKRQQVLNGVSLKIDEGECIGIIGESGSGKSTLGRIILGIEKPDEGCVTFLGSSNLKMFQGLKSVVFQDYVSSVNPRFRVRQIVAEPLIQQGVNKKEIPSIVLKSLEQVGLSEDFVDRYPHELSGGQLQRVCVARAISTSPKFILLDEAVSSLDMSVQVQVLDLLMELKEKYNLSYLFITHDLLTVTYICDKVLFFKEGQVVEFVDDIRGLKNVKHPYARQLLDHI